MDDHRKGNCVAFLEKGRAGRSLAKGHDVSKIASKQECALVCLRASWIDVLLFECGELCISADVAGLGGGYSLLEGGI